MFVQLLLFIAGFLLFIGLILVHEWGHFIVARRNGVEIEEFGLGIPPRAWRKKLKSGLILSLNWLPLGGFVKLKGENDSDSRPGSFGAASLWVKTKIMLAGVTMNFIAGILLLTIVALIGMPKLIDNQFSIKSDTKIVSNQVIVSYIEPDSPADKAGLSGRDIIKSLSVGNQTMPVHNIQDLLNAASTSAGQTINLEIKHNGKEIIKEIKLKDKTEVAASLKTDKPKGYLGVGPSELQVYRATWSAPIVALGFTKQLIGLTFQGLGQALSGLGSIIAGLVTSNEQAKSNGSEKATSQVAGPVAIMAVLWGGGYLGFNFVLMVIAIISLTLALMNILPIPALDGGRLLMAFLSRGILRRPLSKSSEEWIVGASMVMLLTLFILITFVDVKRFF